MNTVKNYTEYLESSFLMLFVNQFSYSRGKQLISPKKVYCFVIKEGLRVKELIQVCYSMNEETEKREVRSLMEAMDEFKLREGLIITEDLDTEEKVDGKKIRFQPLWKWLLEIP